MKKKCLEVWKIAKRDVLRVFTPLGFPRRNETAKTCEAMGGRFPSKHYAARVKDGREGRSLLTSAEDDYLNCKEICSDIARAAKHNS